LKSINHINDPRIVKGLAHPLRISILEILMDREASPSQLADELNAPLGNVSYHVRILDNLGLIKLTRKKPRRGAIEHYYKARGRARVTDSAWGEVPEIVKEAFVNSALHQIGNFITQAATIGGFDRADAHLTRQPLTVDEQGFRELAAAFMRLHDEVHEIHERAGERLREANHDDEIHAGAVLMLFEAPPERPYDGDSDAWSISRPERRRGARPRAKQVS
jgi:DNA-binding transcriptional ArsR family regulator